MIKVEKKIVEAECDGCYKSLIGPSEPHNTNYGLLRPSFGYGSRLDDTVGSSDRHVCENCWEKALKAIGLKVD